MKKFLSTLSILNLLLPFFQIVNAENYKFLDGQHSGNELKIYGISSTGSSTLLNTYNGSDNHLEVDWTNGHVDEYRGKVYVDAIEADDGSLVKISADPLKHRIMSSPGHFSREISLPG